MQFLDLSHALPSFSTGGDILRGLKLFTCSQPPKADGISTNPSLDA